MKKPLMGSVRWAWRSTPERRRPRRLSLMRQSEKSPMLPPPMLREPTTRSR